MPRRGETGGSEGASGPSRTTPVVEGDHAPRLPHERDESSDSQQTPEVHPVIEQAGADLAAGRVDTDRGPVLDEVYEQKVRPAGEATRDRGAPQKRP